MFFIVPTAFDMMDHNHTVRCLETEVDIKLYALNPFKSFLMYWT